MKIKMVAVLIFFCFISLVLGGCLGSDDNEKSIKVEIIKVNQGDYDKALLMNYNLTNIESHTLYSIKVKAISLAINDLDNNIVSASNNSIDELSVGETKNVWMGIIVSNSTGLLYNSTGKVRLLITWEWNGEHSYTRDYVFRLGEG